MPLHQALLSVNSGEISPYLIHRTDFAKHGGSAERMRNFLPLPFGAFTKRPGTLWLAAMAGAGLNSKAFPFTSSNGARYVLHFTPGFLKVYRTNGTVAASLPFLTGHTWGTFSWDSSIRALQMEQINDVAFFSHPLIHPLRLVSLADNEWSLNWLPFVEAPMLDENTDPNRLFSVNSNPIAPSWGTEAYTAGMVVYADLSEWTCQAAHTGATVNRPGTGTTWKNFWARKFYVKGDPITITAKDTVAPQWVGLFNSFAVNDVRISLPTYVVGNSAWVTDVDVVFVCNVAHTPTMAGTIMVGNVNMEQSVDSSKWAIAPPWAKTLPPHNTGVYAGIYGVFFHVGSCCHHKGKAYRSIFAHSSETSPGLYEPGVGSDWGSRWVEVKSFGTPAIYVPSNFYTAGTVVQAYGKKFQCILSHYASLTRHPDTGSVRMAYWQETSLFISDISASTRSPGNYWRLAPERDSRDFQVELKAITANNGAISSYLVVDGAWNFFTYGIWHGTFFVERSTDNGVKWETIREYQASGDRNIAQDGVEDSPSFLRIRFTSEEGTLATGNQRAVLIPESGSVTGYALMTQYVNANEMRGFASTSMLSGSTARWSKGAFDEGQGFPRALAFHGFRLWFAGTTRNPVSYWFSRIEDFTNFEVGTEDDQAGFGTLATSNHTPIRWLASTRRLFMGTSVGEWVEGSETSDDPITPTNVQWRAYTPHGSCPQQPLKVHDGLFFLGRSGGRLYELSAAASNETFAAADLSRLAEHLTKPGISNFAFQQTREPCLWSVTRDGNLLSFHYSRSEQIAAWAMHTTTGGVFRDVLMFPSDGGDDEIFFVIDRDGVAQLERFPQNWQATQEAGVVGNYVDAAGRVGGDLPIVSELKLPPQDLGLEGGSSHGRMKRANEMLLNVYQSFGGGVSYAGETVDYDYSGSSDVTDLAHPLVTGWLELTLPPAHVVDLQPAIVHSSPHPFTVRAMVLRWTLQEP